VPFFDGCVRCLVGQPVSVLLRWIMVLSPFIWFGGIMGLGIWMPEGKARSRTMLVWAIASPWLFGLLPIALTSDIPARYSPLVLREGPFDWPSGCSPREYADGDPISISCHDYRNTLARKLVFDHGFPGIIGRTEQDYFRVGTEAVNFDCNYFTDQCSVRHAQHNVFR
jgi:hypothetical protein